MTDIVERLRGAANDCITCYEEDRLLEAADEIERLRRDHDYDAIRWAEVHKEAQAEIERLREVLTRITDPTFPGMKTERDIIKALQNIARCALEGFPDD